MSSGKGVEPGSLAGAFASLAALNPGGQDKLAAALKQAGINSPKAPAVSRDEVVAMSAPLELEGGASEKVPPVGAGALQQLQARIATAPVLLQDFVRVIENNSAAALGNSDLVSNLLKQNLAVIVERLVQRTQEREELGPNAHQQARMKVSRPAAALIEELQHVFLVLRPGEKDANTFMSLLRSNDAHITRQKFIDSAISQLEGTTPFKDPERARLRSVLDEKINEAGRAIDKMLLQTIYHSAPNPILAKHGILRNRELMATEGLPTQFQYFDDSNRPSLQDLANHLLHTIQTRKAINKTEHGEQALKLTEGRFRQ